MTIVYIIVCILLTISFIYSIRENLKEDKPKNYRTRIWYKIDMNKLPNNKSKEILQHILKMHNPNGIVFYLWEDDFESSMWNGYVTILNKAC
jgi:hypothetical protein